MRGARSLSQFDGWKDGIAKRSTGCGCEWRADLPSVDVDSYNVELEDDEGFIGDRASKEMRRLSDLAALPNPSASAELYILKGTCSGQAAGLTASGDTDETAV